MNIYRTSIDPSCWIHIGYLLAILDHVGHIGLCWPYLNVRHMDYVGHIGVCWAILSYIRLDCYSMEKISGTLNT